VLERSVAPPSGSSPSEGAGTATDDASVFAHVSPMASNERGGNDASVTSDHSRSINNNTIHPRSPQTKAPNHISPRLSFQQHPPINMSSPQRRGSTSPSTGAIPNSSFGSSMRSHRGPARMSIFIATPTDATQQRDALGSPVTPHHASPRNPTSPRIPATALQHSSTRMHSPRPPSPHSTTASGPRRPTARPSTAATNVNPTERPSSFQGPTPPSTKGSSQCARRTVTDASTLNSLISSIRASTVSTSTSSINKVQGQSDRATIDKWFGNSGSTTTTATTERGGDDESGNKIQYLPTQHPKPKKNEAAEKRKLLRGPLKRN
jgi:hypothetical protein